VSQAEIWTVIPDTGDLYEASSLGRIRSKDRTIRRRCRWGQMIDQRKAGRVLKPWADAGGYLVVYICFAGKRVATNVHRLVAIAFHGPAEGRDVNHANGDKTDNRPDNLEWCSHAENMAHARSTGLLNDRRVIFAMPKNGGAPIRFASITEATRAVGANRNANIISAANGRIPSAYGYRWQYENAA
jgi:hypothetical protein